MLDAQGVERMFPDESAPVASVISQCARDVLRSGGVAVQDVYRDEDGQRIYLSAMVLILSEQHRKLVIGMIVVQHDPEHYLYPFVSRSPTQNRTAEKLLRREDDDAVFWNNLKFQKNTALNLRISQESQDVPVVKAVLGKKGNAEGRHYRGRRKQPACGQSSTLHGS